MEKKPNIAAYNVIKANRYDHESTVIRGNREAHKNSLLDILSYIKNDQKVFVDLGCGTGELTDLFFKIFPSITGYLIDGSEEMLSKSKERFIGLGNKLIFKCMALEELNWDTFELPPDIIFSSFAIHHLENIHKWKLYQKAYQQLNAGGVFILFDYFRPEDKKSDNLLEFLACMDIKRRAETKLRKVIDITKIIENDRKAKDAEGDKEGSLEEHYKKLTEIGFKSVTIVFKEARLAGIVGFKN